MESFSHPYAHNLQYLWASLVVEELIKLGCRYFVLSPGMRSAPLAGAVAVATKTHNIIRADICIDERGAAYQALGYAKAKGVASVLICTSGTALANYLPAVMEAYHEQVPLLVLSADRPPELLDCGANQTTRQVGIFGDFVKGCLNLSVPTENISPHTFLRQIDGLWSEGHRHPVGPLHINFPFRDPLEPVPTSSSCSTTNAMIAAEIFRRKTPLTTFAPTKLCVEEHYLKEIQQCWQQSQRPLVVLGALSWEAPLSSSKIEISPNFQNFQKLLQHLNCPIFCDISSSLKQAGPYFFDLDHPAQFSLLKEYRPDFILHLGGRLVGKNFYDYLALPEVENSYKYVVVHHHPWRQDPVHRCDVKVQMSLDIFVDTVLTTWTPQMDRPSAKEISRRLQQQQTTMAQELQQLPLSYLALAHSLLALIPRPSGLYLGNSTPVRAFDSVTPPQQAGGCAPLPPLHVLTNRGVSGIEGQVASSVGWSKGSGWPLTLVLGDLSLMHDMNSLSLAGEVQTPLCIVVMNNFRGGIFAQLPINRYPEIADPYIHTPHGKTFEHLAQHFALPYWQIKSLAEFQDIYPRAMARAGATLLEVILDPQEDLRLYHHCRKLNLNRS